MKIVQLLSGLPTAITNEEKQFVDRYNSSVKITSLDEHDQWLAQNLVRKGIYSISKDNITLINNSNETNDRTSL
jgi:hypothetical protein